MPYTVQNLIEGRSDPVCVNPEDKVRKALSLMIEFDYSQLPVIDTRNRPIGMVTHESINRAISNFGASIDELYVSDAIEKAATFRPEQDLFELLDRLRDTNANLIVDGEQKLIGIVTSYDSTEYFRRRAEDMMHIEDIETMLKDLVLIPFSTKNGELIQEDLDTAIENITSSSEDLKKNYKKALVDYLSLQEFDIRLEPASVNKSFIHLAPKKEVKEFDQLTLSEYIALLVHPKHWDNYQPLLNIGRQALSNLLDSVRDIRNTLAHFRDEISPVQRDRLKFCVDWLNLHSAIPFSWPVTANVEQEMTTSNQVIKEPKGSYDVFKDTLNEITPTQESLGPQESRYAPLAILLRSQPTSIDRIPVTFEEIEAVINDDLPESAQKHRAWWANDPSHSHAQQWLDVGWRTSWVNLTEEKLTFVRIIEREKAYIDFFSELLTDLKEKAKFNVRDVSPDGQSWIVIYTLPENGPQLALLSVSFARGKRLRVEIYIDTNDKNENKSIFDRIYHHKEKIESALGDQLSWERMDDKRACRIALYRDGSINDTKEELLGLRDWSVQSITRFYNAIKGPTTEAIGSY